ncbi:S8 family serine peptidase [candidate division KSB1 bacterium]|nr:S8 family serine peptidase [candidate division KSB1 bacterium]
MSKTVSILIIVLFSCGQISAKQESALHYSYVPGQLLVKFREPLQDSKIETVQKLVRAQKSAPLFANRQRLFSPRPVQLFQVYKFFTFPQNDMVRLAQQISALSFVEWAEPNYLLPTEAVPNDSLFPQLFFLHQIYAPEAWDIVRGDSGIIIAIIDTGVDLVHPDLSPSIWHNDEILDGNDTDGNGYVDDVYGWDFVDNITDAAYGEDGRTPDNNPSDFDGHGTFVAGLAAAATDNLIGTSSVSWGCRIMPLRVGYKSYTGGYIVLDAAAKAFVYAADNGAHVINFSTSSGNILIEAARYAFDRGVVIVKSAGNERSSLADPLELEPYVITVCAVDDRDFKASYADYGDWVSVCAPGGDLTNGRPGMISTTMQGDYAVMQGSSFAAPVVSGLAGLLRSYDPKKSAADIVFQITETADNIDFLNPAYRGKLGTGRVNAVRALQESVTVSPRLSFKFFDVYDTAGNQNGALDPGETVELVVTLHNSRATAQNVSLELIVDHHEILVKKSTAFLPRIAGIEDIYNSSANNKTDPFILSAPENVLPQRIPAIIRATEQNGSSWEFTFFIPVYPTVLMVDDDDGTVNVEDYYFEALDSLGLTCFRWDHQQRGYPSEVMKNYSNAIWFCEQTGSITPTLDSLDRKIVADYLDNGGNLFLSGQDIGWDLYEYPGPKYINQFILSIGASWTFYRQYLHAHYLLDASVYMFMYGVENDPIGDSLVFRFGQPGRTYQYPSEILPLEDAVSVFDYPNNKSGAVRFDGDYRLVYFAFGGLEAIEEKSLRPLVLQRILNWMNGIKTAHSPHTDVTWDSTGVTFLFKVQPDRFPVSSVRLYARSGNDSGYFVKSMRSVGDTLFKTTIPLPPHPAVQYAFVNQLENGFVAPVKKYFIHLDYDTTGIFFENLTESWICPENIRFSTRLTSETPVDTQQVFLFFSRDGAPFDSLLMTFENSGTFTVESAENFIPGDTVSYYFSAKKTAWSRLESVSQSDTLIVGYESFEYGSDFWRQEPEVWSLDSTGAYNGRYCFFTGGGADTSVLELSCALDFSQMLSPAVSFYTCHQFSKNEMTGRLQIKLEGENEWIDAGPVMTGNITDWYPVVVTLDNCSGQKVLFRFIAVYKNGSPSPEFFWKLDEIFVFDRQQVRVEFQKPDPVKNGLSVDNYPNPFNTGTVVRYTVTRPSEVRIFVYDIRGRRIRTLLKDWRATGTYSLVWDGRNDMGGACPTGIYFLCLYGEEQYYFKKMLLLR